MQQTAPIVVPVKSGRTTDIDLKRRKTAYRAGLVVCLSKSSDVFDRQCVGDSDSRLFTADKRVLGVSALTPDIGLPVCSVAVGGVINILNTGKWPVQEFDVIYAAINKHPRLDANDYWSDPNQNKYLPFDEPWPIVCSNIYARDPVYFGKPDLTPNSSCCWDTDRYHIRRVGIAISGEFSNASDACTHLFSILLDEPQAML